MKQKKQTILLSFFFSLASASTAFASPTGIDTSLQFFGIVEKLATAIWYVAPGIGLLCFAGAVFQLATRGAEGNHLMANLFWGAAGCAALWGADNKFLKWWMGNTSSGATIDDIISNAVCVPQINDGFLLIALYAALSIGLYFSCKKIQKIKTVTC